MWQQGRMLLPTVLVAERMTERMRGLLGRRFLEEGSGMLLRPCGSIHTVGMQFGIDVIYFDPAWRVVRTVRNLKPWRMSVGGLHTCAALELQSGWFDLSALQPGLPVSFEETDERIAPDA